MSTDRFEILLSDYLDGTLHSESEAEFTALLRENPDFAIRTRHELELVDLIEQSLKPNRSFNAFLDGLETRVRAEETADQFLADLLPKLKEVDEREANIEQNEPEEGKIVHFPQQKVAWTVGLSAAAAIAVLFTIPLLLNPPSSQPIAKLAFSEESTPVFEEGPETIEFRDGDDLRPGSPVRLKSGRVRIETNSGSVVTIEGPADFRLLSESNGVLTEGTMTAKVSPESPSMEIDTPNMALTLSEGTAGVTQEGGKTEAGLISGQDDALVVTERTPFSQQPFDPARYHKQLPLLAGVTRRNGPIAFAIPGLNPAKDASTIILVLEKEDLHLRNESLTLDYVFDSGFSSPSNKVENAHELVISEGIRSYLLQLDSILNRGKNSDDFVDAFVTFDNPIVGLSTSGSTLKVNDSLASDELAALLSAMGDQERGLGNDDSVAVRKDGRTLDLRMKVAGRTSVGQLRVFVLSR